MDDPEPMIWGLRVSIPRPRIPRLGTDPHQPAQTRTAEGGGGFLRHAIRTAPPVVDGESGPAANSRTPDLPRDRCSAKARKAIAAMMRIQKPDIETLREATG